MDPVGQQQPLGSVDANSTAGRTLVSHSQSPRAQINTLAKGTEVQDFSEEKKYVEKGVTTATQNEQLRSTKEPTSLADTALPQAERVAPNHLYSDDIEASAGTQEASARTQESSATTQEATSDTAKQVRHNQHVNDAERRAGFTRRLGLALFGGVSLIVPMIIMSINNSLHKSLITSSCFVLAFAVGMAWFAAARDAEMIAGTAAYAAVLVVFVGVSIKP